MLQEIKRFIEGLEELPTVSPVVLKLISVASDPDAGLREVARILQADQSLASKILRLANSPAFGFSGRIASIDRATALLGLDLVRSAALSVIVVDLFRDEKDSEMPLCEFWRHSMTCALASEALADRLGHKNAKEAFLAGLLHDIGKLVLLKWDRQKYDAVLKEARDREEPLLAVEERILGAGHTWVAKTLMEHWHFPDSIRNAAWLHHQPPSHFGDRPHQHTAFIVGCADSLCHHFRFGASGNAVTLFDLDVLSARSGLPVADLVDISSRILRDYDDVAAQFDWQGGDSAELYMGTVTRANRELTRIHLDLQSRNAELMRRQRIMESIRVLQETVNPPSSCASGLKVAVELLSRVLKTRRLVAVAPQPAHKGFEGWLLVHGSSSPQRIEFSLTTDAGDDLTRLPQRQQVALIIRSLEAAGEDLEAPHEVRGALRSPDLLVVPLTSGRRILGQIFADLDLQSQEEKRGEAAEMLQQFARSLAICLERIMLFDELDRQNELLARMSRQQESVRSKLSQSERLASVGRLAAGAAHEINNPLTIISAQSQLLLSSASSRKQRDALSNVLQQSERIAKIVRDLMGLARPAKPQAQPVDVKKVLEQSLGSLQDRLEQNDVALETDFQPVRPLQADPRQLEQVFINLAVNAVQAMQGGGRLTVRLKPDAQRQGVLIDFSDTGHGIADDHLKSIFDPFFSTKKEGQGVGLGLAICHSIVQAHSGEVRVSSRLGEGTTFTIRLPQRGVAGSPPSPPRSSQVPRLRPVPSGCQRVLIVDREAALSRILAETLSPHGFKVDTADDSDQARQMAAETDYSAAVVDMRLNGACESKLVKHLNKTRPKIKIIATSGSTDKNEFAAVKDLAALCLRKPFHPQRLLEALHQALQPGRTAAPPFRERSASA
ncbi:MAG TPA: HDOD domain-containing protein [Acidobacteriota bacterium]|nr:HDOD domain-containing protein [Acidobacteriota bacterium]